MCVTVTALACVVDPEERACTHSASLSFQDSADSPFVPIMRASHVIKGAASNLMCAQLRQCAMSLETAASTAANDNADSNATHMATVKEKFEDLKVAVEAYHKYLDDVGV